jgi:acyl-CoA thioester hydrolase
MPHRYAGVSQKMIPFEEGYVQPLDQVRGMPPRRDAVSDPIEVPHDGRPVFVMHLRVRQYETDALGHVNNAVYLNYLEQAAIEHAESMGFGKARLAELGGFFVVRRHEIDYLGSAVAGDELAITTWPEMLSGPRAVRCYEIRNTTSAKRIVTARTLWVWIDRMTGRPRPMPRAILDAYAVKAGTPDQQDS